MDVQPRHNAMPIFQLSESILTRPSTNKMLVATKSGYPIKYFLSIGDSMERRKLAKPPATHFIKEESTKHWQDVDKEKNGH